jgi:hypothetical protein
VVRVRQSEKIFKFYSTDFCDAKIQLGGRGWEWRIAAAGRQ